MSDPESARRRTVLWGVSLSVCGSCLFAAWPASDGRTAALLNGANFLLLAVHFLRRRDGPLARLLVFGIALGLVELIADALCVGMTKTLDYAPARSAMLLASPWWMPSAWAVVALQSGYLGAWALRRWGWVRGLALALLMGLIHIPLYEELAYHAHWWRYVHCRQILHTPLYIIVAEGLIVAGIAPLARQVLEKAGFRQAAAIGLLAGLWTVVAGMIGYGLCEFIPNGLRLP